MLDEDNIEEKDTRKKTSIAKRLIIFVVLGNFVIATLITSYNLLEAWKKNLETIQKGFVQINVANIGAQFTRLRDANHRVEIRPIEIHLAAG